MPLLYDYFVLFLTLCLIFHVHFRAKRKHQDKSAKRDKKADRRFEKLQRQLQAERKQRAKIQAELDNLRRQESSSTSGNESSSSSTASSASAYSKSTIQNDSSDDAKLTQKKEKAKQIKKGNSNEKHHVRTVLLEPTPVVSFTVSTEKQAETSKTKPVANDTLNEAEQTQPETEKRRAITTLSGSDTETDGEKQYSRCKKQKSETEISKQQQTFDTNYQKGCITKEQKAKGSVEELCKKLFGGNTPPKEPTPSTSKQQPILVSQQTDPELEISVDQAIFEIPQIETLPQFEVHPLIEEVILTEHHTIGRILRDASSKETKPKLRLADYVRYSLDALGAPNQTNANHKKAIALMGAVQYKKLWPTVPKQFKTTSLEFIFLGMGRPNTTFYRPRIEYHLRTHTPAWRLHTTERIKAKCLMVEELANGFLKNLAHMVNMGQLTDQLLLNIRSLQLACNLQTNGSYYKITNVVRNPNGQIQEIRYTGCRAVNWHRPIRRLFQVRDDVNGMIETMQAHFRVMEAYWRGENMVETRREPMLQERLQDDFCDKCTPCSDCFQKERARDLAWKALETVTQEDQGVLEELRPFKHNPLGLDYSDLLQSSDGTVEAKFPR
jgi:hypothetical protein